MKTLWIVEDHAAFRRTLVRVLNSEPDWHCPRNFDSCEKALAALTDGDAPDLIMLDVGLPGMSGLEGIRLFKVRAPNSLIVILTVFEDDEKIFRAVCAGASGYLLKSASMLEITEAVAEVRRGGSPMTPRVARRVLDMFSKLAPARNDYGLGPREREVLELYVKGLTNKEIANKLSLSVHTIDSYNKSLYEKLQVNTRSGAVAKALKERLV